MHLSLSPTEFSVMNQNSQTESGHWLLLSKLQTLPFRSSNILRTFENLWNLHCGQSTDRQLRHSFPCHNPALLWGYSVAGMSRDASYTSQCTVLKHSSKETPSEAHAIEVQPITCISSVLCSILLTEESLALRLFTHWTWNGISSHRRILLLLFWDEQW